MLLCIQLRYEGTRKDHTALLGLWFSPSVTERSQNEPETRSLRLKALDSATPLAMSLVDPLDLSEPQFPNL